MAVSLNINTDNNTLNQKQRFNIDGDAYFLRTYYNSRIFEGSSDRDGSWYVALFDVDENPILLGIRVMPGRNMFEKADPSLLFSGEVRCVDTFEDSEDDLITLDNFGQGKRFQLWYFSQEEIAEFLATQ